jgi:hypothetical protein
MPTQKKPKTKARINKDTDPAYTIVVVGDDGQYYKLLGKEWRQEKYRVSNDRMAQAGVIDQLTKWGTYLAYLPTDVAAGVGNLCTLVNLQAIIESRVGQATVKKTKRPKK